MVRVFLGVDSRQPIAPQVLAHSIYTRSSVPVSITPLVIGQLPMKRTGLTQFSFSRYIVPHLCGFSGMAIFMDADMLCLGDIAELEKLADPMDSVSVVKNPRRFEWPSLMVFNCALCLRLTPTFIESDNPSDLKWAKSVGELPSEWNHIIPYDKPRKDAKVVHYTAGIPCWPETKDCEYASEWQAERKLSNSTVSWEELMGSSVHRKAVGK